MSQIIVSTTFRDFDNSSNDRMQINFLRSLKSQTFQDFILVVTVFNEKNVDKVVEEILGDKVVIIYDHGCGKYKFSLSRTFMNGVDYGLENHAEILIDCSSDIVLQENFLETVRKRTGMLTAGISHPNVFRKKMSSGKTKYFYGRLNWGIDVRFYSLDLFQSIHVHNILNRFPSYDYGAGIEIVLCGIAVKYAVKRYNIFMESKVLKEENARGMETGMVIDGNRRNIPTSMRFIRNEHIPWRYVQLVEMNRAYRVTKSTWLYWLWFGREIIHFYYNRIKERRNDKA